MDLGRPLLVFGCLVLECVGRLGGMEIVPVTQGGENGGKIVTATSRWTRRRRPRAETIRGQQFAGRQFSGWQTLEYRQPPIHRYRLDVPGVAPGISDDTKTAARLPAPHLSGGDREALISIDRPRPEHLPGTQGHGDRAGTEHRTGTGAEDKGPDPGKAEAGALQHRFCSGEKGRARLLG